MSVVLVVRRIGDARKFGDYRACRRGFTSPLIPPLRGGRGGGVPRESAKT